MISTVAAADDPQVLAGALARATPDALANINAALHLAELTAVLQIWRNSRGSGDEEFWQTTLAEHSWVLEGSMETQLFESGLFSRDLLTIEHLLQFRRRNVPDGF